MELILIMSSPVIMVFVSFVVFIISKSKTSHNDAGLMLMNKSIKYALIGAGITLIYTIVSMVWYEKTTGYSAGNGPLGWLFFYGPLGIALGQILALIKWRIELKHITSSSSVTNNP